MTLDLQAHWQAIYNAVRAGLDAALFDDVPLLHIESGHGPNSERISPPFVTYRDETARTLGTTGAGSLKVLTTGWVFTARSHDLEEALDLASAVTNALVDANFTTTDGYTTTSLELIGDMTLWETDFEVNAVHLRFQWERST